jgi:hypothetical protein
MMLLLADVSLIGPIPCGSRDYGINFAPSVLIPKTTQGDNRPRGDKRHTASDDAVMERFKKRMRK